VKRIRGRGIGALVATVALAGTVLSACSSGGGSSSQVPASSKQTLTLWENYGTEQNAVATKALAVAYHKLNPNITINVVSQPADNYFSLLQASAISKKGPDLAVMWTGLYALQYSSFLENLQSHIPAASLAQVNGLNWMSPNFTTSNGPLVMPLETQFYIGFYNKADFAKAGITSVPKTWSELNNACSALKAVGITPIVYGNGGQALGAEFYPWYDMSYLMIGAHSLAGWKGLYDGSSPWTSQANVAQLTKWAALKSSGCTNSDVLTKTNNIQDFESGKAAMMIDGTWDTAQYTSTMGSNVAAFVPPYSDTPINGVVQFPGDGFSVMKYSSHQAAAYKFLTWMTTQAAGAIVNQAGLIPDIKGMTTTNPVNQQMLNFVSSGMTVYPMLDNAVQVNVVNAGSKVLPSVLAGQQSPLSALQNMQQVLNSLPASQRSSSNYAG
jgi:ABC-type glycerol-3-phosphate transport system substrate-binding protein